MSVNNTTRKPARRAFCFEVEKSQYVYKENPDIESSPKFELLRSGVKANRLFMEGTVTEVGETDSGQRYIQFSDPTGTIRIYAGQYQPEPRTKMKELQTPEFVSVSVKPDMFEGDDGENILSLKAEKIVLVDKEDVENWQKETLQKTIERLENHTEPNEKVKEVYKDKKPINWSENLQKAKEIIKSPSLT